MWNAKQQIICSLSESLWDVYNYGLFQPAGEGRDAKFLEEERPLRDYSQSFEKGVPYLEVRKGAVTQCKAPLEQHLFLFFLK